MFSAWSTLKTRIAPHPPCGEDRKRFLTPSTEQTLSDFAAGRTAALARVVSIIENRRPDADDVLASLHPKVGGARRIGITGPPGAGKSTITTLVARDYR